MPSVTTQPKETDTSATKTARGYSAVSPVEDKNDEIGRLNGERDDIELSVIGNSSNFSQRDLEILLENMKVLFPLIFFFLESEAKFVDLVLWQFHTRHFL